MSLRQEDVQLRGWAIECRITAEDATNGFLPSLGRVTHVSEPSGPGVRVDSSLFPGLEIGPNYDSLVAKLCVWGSDRPQALARLRRSLDEYQLAGVKTTLAFHRNLIDHPAFVAGELETRFLERNVLEAAEAPEAADQALLIAALLSHDRKRNGTGNGGTNGKAGKGSAWRRAGILAGRGRAEGTSWRSTF